MIRHRDGSTPVHSRPTRSRPASGTTRSFSVAGATTTHACGVTPELYAARVMAAEDAMRRQPARDGTRTGPPGWPDSTPWVVGRGAGRGESVAVPSTYPGVTDVFDPPAT